MDVPHQFTANDSQSASVWPKKPKMTILGKSLRGMDEALRRDRLLYLLGVIEGIAFETVYFIDELIDHGNYLKVVLETTPSLEHMACVLDAWKQYSVSGDGAVEHTVRTKSSCFTAVYAHSLTDLQLHRTAFPSRTIALNIEPEDEPSHHSEMDEDESLVEEQDSEQLPF
ncbi:MAG: hypothetical protein JNJ77_05175 [Planctomycetia bacterium]|nr:hypothetical protein [Planctomycetia bacterium]